MAIKEETDLKLAQSEPTGTDTAVVGYRILCSLAVLMGGYLHSVVALLCGDYLMLRVTRYYLAFTRGDRELWPKKSRYIRKVIGMAGVTALILALSI